MQTHHEDTAEQIFGEYRWRSFAPVDLLIHDGTLEEAASALNLDPAEVAWGCEEFGRCDTEFPGESTNGLVAWIPSEENGFEWPTAEAPTEDNNYDSPR
jgi:hypothetical protein